MTSFSGQVATPRWNTGASETPLPSPPRKFPTSEGGGLKKPPPFLFADDLLQIGRQHGVQARNSSPGTFEVSVRPLHPVYLVVRCLHEK